MSDGYNVISGILNVINVVSHYLRGDGKVFPRHQHARHAITFYTIRKIPMMTSEEYYRSLFTHMTTRWLDLFTCDPQLYEYIIPGIQLNLVTSTLDNN